MTSSRVRNEFIIRLLIPTVLMVVALLYLGSLWDARSREQNLVLIQPVVVAMLPFYLWVIVFEIQKFQAERRGVPTSGAVAAGEIRKGSGWLAFQFMAVSVISVPLFYGFGGVPATLVSMVAGLLVLGIRRPAILFGVPLAVTLVLWLVFIESFGIRMPLFTLP